MANFNIIINGIGLYDPQRAAPVTNLLMLRPEARTINEGIRGEEVTYFEFTHNPGSEIVFLPWQAGHITSMNIGTAQANNIDILSGKFSGCIFGYIRETDGGYSAWHVNIDSAKDCTADWGIIKRGRESRECNPWQPFRNAKLNLSHSAYCLGVIRNFTDCYSLLISRAPATYGKIIGIYHFQGENARCAFTDDALDSSCCCVVQ